MDLSTFEAPGTLREAIVEYLRSEIISGGLEAGHAIKDAELARQLGVSITPVREAVMQLTAEGWLETLPNKRRRVATFTQRDATEAMDVEFVVIRALLERAGPRVSTRHHANLEQGLDAFCRALLSHSEPQARPGFDLIIDTLLEAADHKELEQLVKFVVGRSSARLVVYPSEHLISSWVSSMTGIVHHIEAGEIVDALNVFDAHAQFILKAMSEDRDAGAALKVVASPPVPGSPRAEFGRRQRTFPKAAT